MVWTKDPDKVVVPNVTEAPERKFESTSGREYERKDISEQYVNGLDKELKQVRKQTKRHPFTFILQYIGVCYIVLAFFKGLFYKFSPSFDLIGVVIFIIGFTWERINVARAEKELRQHAEEENQIVYGPKGD